MPRIVEFTDIALSVLQDKALMDEKTSLHVHTMDVNTHQIAESKSEVTK